MQCEDLNFCPEPISDADNHEAGLTVFMNEQHHCEIAITHELGERFIVVRRRIGDLVTIVAREALVHGFVELEIHADIHQYTFFYTLAHQSPCSIATSSTRYLSTEVAGGFTGVYFGLYVTSNGNGKTAPADFDWFEYCPL